jgi:catechol 2,3-dioxygenase-like lactoylglutathione lyase family enzyme
MPTQRPFARLGHVCVEVRDIRPSLWFYDRFLGRLGFPKFVEDADYAGYGRGDFAVWVIRPSYERVRRRPVKDDEEVVAEHLAFRVDTAADVARVQEDLERQEIYPTYRCEEHPEFAPGYVSATWVDPDQNVLEVYYTHPPKPKRQGKPKATAKRAATGPRARRVRR